MGRYYRRRGRSSAFKNIWIGKRWITVKVGGAQGATPQGSIGDRYVVKFVDREQEEQLK